MSPLRFVACLLGVLAPLTAADAPGRRSAPTTSPPAAVALTDAKGTIDRLVDEHLAKAGVKPTPRTTDEQFLRRIYLDAAGRIPSYEETRAFLDSRASDKRSQLIAKLVGSPGWVSHQFNWWADLLRAETRMMNRYPGQPYLDWIKISLRENKPYDAMVRELLRAEGHALEKGHGATGYYVRDIGMPLDNMANTVQVFLGTRVACAQCHDHPTDVWKRHDFFEMAAYTASTQVRRDFSYAASGPGALKARREMGAQPPDVRNAFRQLGYTIGLRVEDSTKATIPLPHDYQYTDHKPGEAVPAHALFGDAATVKKGGDPRETYATWMTSPLNPRFTAVIANRMWKKVMGTGVVEPVDNFTDDTRAANPALFTYITKLMTDVGYDLRRFQQILFESETYQRSASRSEAVAGETYYFAGAMLRRLSAEQLWDSLLTLAIADPDALHGDTAEPLYAYYEANKDKTAQELMAMAIEMGSTRAKAGELQKEFAELRAKMANAAPGEIKALREQLKALGDKRQELMSGPNGDMTRYKGPNAKGKSGMAMLRASELPSPAPQGHFLRTFGQSDREVIENASTDPTVTQALSLLNGSLHADLMAATSPMMQAVARARDPREKVRTLFLAILSREPTPKELLLLQTHAQDAGVGTLGDVAWTLINSSEFKFLQ